MLQHSGRCQSLMVLDRNVAGNCQDKMIEQSGSLGERGFLFQMNDGAVVLFVAIDKPPDASGTRTMPLSRIDFGLGAQVETVPVLGGACVTTDPKTTFRAATVCDASTVKGGFAAQFVTIDGATKSLRSK